MNTDIAKRAILKIFENYGYNRMLQDSFKSCNLKYIESSKQTSDLKEDVLIKNKTQLLLNKLHLISINFYLRKKLLNCSRLLNKLKLIYVNNKYIRLLYKYGVKVTNLDINPWNKIIRIDNFYYCIAKMLGSIYTITGINLMESISSEDEDQNDNKNIEKHEDEKHDEDKDDYIFENDKNGYIFEDYIFKKLHELKEL